MEKLFQKAVWACVLAFLVLLGSWFLMIDLRSTDFYTPLQGIAIRRRGMEFSADRVSEIPPPAPTVNKRGRRNPPPEPPPPPASPISYSPPVPPPPPASPSIYPQLLPLPPPASHYSYP
ncbi:leucine-rich repeat extensin-like protein 3 isoform X2 [Magnolia sinica]|uniref:leucine-rich repeat extensin-like protein 3 isoform X2 n=1 Tax=Magnolia sinica TaxID=86752 RepID=UPI0026599E2F|nr:leucine-rich repeat extensin-like protein 3 isoform X2 [Magnolia sinica]